MHLRTNVWLKVSKISHLTDVTADDLAGIGISFIIYI